MKTALEPLEYLFWRTLIRTFRGCPPLGDVFSNNTLYRNLKLDTKKVLPVAARVPRALSLHWRDKREKRVVLPRVGILATSRCTLNCDKCLAHVSDRKRCNKKDAPIDELARDIHALFSCVDYIYEISVAGGEPFLHPDLDQIIRACADSGKTGHINVSTNGTLLPGAKVLAALRETKATVHISRYPVALQPQAEQLKCILRENAIPYIHASSASWVDTGKFGQAQEGSPARRFRVCPLQLCYIYDCGKLHLCGQSAVLMAEELIPDCKEDYIDLRAVSRGEFREQYVKLRRRPCISACSYCLGQTYKTPKIPVAVQRDPPPAG